MERCHLNCDVSAVCRYREFTRKAQSPGCDFQITNHNLVLADVLSRKNGRKSLFPPLGVVIFDEAHKFLGAARQMYGITMENVEIERLTASLFRATGVNNPDKGENVRLCETLLKQNSLLSLKP